jgi:hypothetical protein
MKNQSFVILNEVKDLDSWLQSNGGAGFPASAMAG